MMPDDVEQLQALIARWYADYRGAAVTVYIGVVWGHGFDVSIDHAPGDSAEAADAGEAWDYAMANFVEPLPDDLD